MVYKAQYKEVTLLFGVGLNNTHTKKQHAYPYPKFKEKNTHRHSTWYDICIGCLDKNFKLTQNEFVMFNSIISITNYISDRKRCKKHSLQA